MIAVIIVVIVTLVIAFNICRMAQRRARLRERAQLRHITGGPQWWGHR
jgi:hypothetical protein